MKRIDVSTVIRANHETNVRSFANVSNRETSTLIINVSWKQLGVSIGIVGCVNTNLYIPSNYFKLVGNQPSIKTLVIRFAIRYYAISMFRTDRTFAPDRPLPPPLSTPPSIKVVKVDQEEREIRIKRFVRFENREVCCRICGNIAGELLRQSSHFLHLFAIEIFLLFQFFRSKDFFTSSSLSGHYDYYLTPCVVAFFL